LRVVEIERLHFWA